MSESAGEYGWVPVANGKVAVGHRPGLSSLGRLKLAGCTHVVTILSEREGALTIRDACLRANLQWIWVPLRNAIPPGRVARMSVLTTFRELRELLNASACLFVHCSGGIHRTGMLLAGLFRFLGHSELEALSLIHQLRTVTASGLRPEHLAWARHFAAQAEAPREHTSPGLQFPDK